MSVKRMLFVLLVVALFVVACDASTPAPTTAPVQPPAAATNTPVPPPPTAVPPAPTATPVPPTPTLVPPTVTPSASAQCLACHGNKDLAMKVGTESVPLFVDATAFAAGKHVKVECTACHTGMNPTTPHNAKRTYGSWARFSAKDTDTTKTRNYYVVDGNACLACHKDARYTAFMKSEHATIKDMKFEADGKPRVEVKVKGTDGKEYAIDEDFVANDCERCHVNTNCGTCHWKAQIKQKLAGNVLDLWTKYDTDSDTAKGAMTEYSMDWTLNVASHEFVGKATLTKSNDVCSACHVGYYQGDKSVPAIGVLGIGVRRHPEVQELLLSAKRGVHETKQLCTDCHTELHDLALQNTEHGARLGGKTQCVNCHADKALKAVHADITCTACHDAELNVQRDAEAKMVVAMAVKHSLAESWPSHNLTKEVKCEKCHVAGNKVGATEKVAPGKIH
ncbi:MAG: cytochrome c3 family protein [Chloroflexi bacterium]|nr:cytochrome c3 family protein [Chloroflexota bacterium]